MHNPYSFFIILFFYAMLVSNIHAQETSNSSIVNQVETTGDILQVVLPVGALASTYILDDKEGRVQFWQSYLSSISLTYLLKYTIDKPRPNNQRDDSFPSGHTTAAFSGAMFIQKKYGFKYGIPSLLMASFVGYSRVYAEKHFWEDVIVGASIGILGNLIFTKDYNNRSLSFYKYKDDANLVLGIQF